MTEGKSITYKDGGVICINGTDYDAANLDVKTAPEGKSITLTISAGDETYQFSGSRSGFLKVFSEKSERIDTFLKKYPEWLEESRKYLKALEERADLLRGIAEGRLPSVAPPEGYLLKRGEKVLLCAEGVSYCQEKVKREYYGGGGSVRIVKGFSLRLGKGIPVEKEYIATLDKGRLVLSNKKISFTGNTKSTTIPINKIVEIRRYSDAVTISKEGVMTRPMFVGIDGDLWADVIEAVNNFENA